MIDLYWLYVRDAITRPSFLGMGDADIGELHTIGLRGAGTRGAFDFEAELAFQTGDAERVAPGAAVEQPLALRDRAEGEAQLVVVALAPQPLEHGATLAATPQQDSHDGLGDTAVATRSQAMVAMFMPIASPESNRKRR